MKKTLFLTGALLLSLASLAQAKYTWTGAVSSDWNDKANWVLDAGTTWKEGGPTFGTNILGITPVDKVVLDGSKTNKHSHPKEQSMGFDASNPGKQYSSDLTLQNGSKFKLIIQQSSEPTVVKDPGLFCGSIFTVDASSQLTLDVKDKGRFLSSIGPFNGDWTFNVKGYQGISMIGEAINAASLNCKFIMNLDAYGSMCASNTPGNLDGNAYQLPFVFSGTLGYGSEVCDKAGKGQFSLVSTSGNYEVMSRLLYDVASNTNGNTINLSDETFTDLDGKKLTKSDTKLAADATDLNKYYLYQDANGDVKVDYLVDKSKSIPEPTTATLSLIGLAALLLRRRCA
ncbi:MAG: PEP-CTERM sorting domain-containing protein [Akkermansia sp.]